MSIFSAMRTSVSGMNAQANRISTYSENIANSATVGYKSANAQFETMLIDQSADSYTSGGVDTRIRYGIDQQGVLTGTSSATDLAVNGQGFFVVADSAGNPHLTRAGSFVPDASGYLVNSAGFRLMGTPASSQASATGTGFGGLAEVKIDMTGLVSSPSTSAVFTANLPGSAVAVGAAALPSTNVAGATPTEKSSLVAYDGLGNAVTLDLYMTKTGANGWEAAVFDNSTSTSGGFPYTSGPLATASLQFDPANGNLTSSSAKNVSVPVPGGNNISIDLSGMTQLAAGYSNSNATIDGNAPSQFSKLKVDQDGLISAVYQNGKSIGEFNIKLATVPSIDNLTPVSGNVYDINHLSGNVLIGAPGAGAFGAIASSTLESSTVDIATELTGMIETQRSYTANSKAFQVASDVTDVLVNLKV